MPGVLLWGWDSTNKVWRQVIVNADGKLEIGSVADAEISQATPQSLKHVPHGYYAAGPSYLPLAVDSAGKLQLAIASLPKLDDIEDVSVPAPTDQDVFYWDAATSLWKCRALVDADIPATICRDSELADHAALPDVHHATHLKTLADHPLSIIPTMDDDHIPATIARDAEVATAVSDHAALTTGVHGAGASHLALFGVASTLVTKFTTKSVASELWRRNNANNSSFQALINGTPSATSVVYDNDLRENSLPDPTAYAQWGKVILRNVTRGNSRKITNVNLTTNTITTEASTDNWADNDIITIGSATCVYTGADTYSKFFDIDLSSEVPATAKAVLLEIFSMDLSHVDAASQNNFGAHPFETYGEAKVTHIMANCAYEANMSYIVVSVNSQKICLHLGAFGPIPAAGAVMLARLRGYWE